MIVFVDFYLLACAERELRVSIVMVSSNDKSAHKQVRRGCEVVILHLLMKHFPINMALIYIGLVLFVLLVYVVKGRCSYLHQKRNVSNPLI